MAGHKSLTRSYVGVILAVVVVLVADVVRDAVEFLGKAVAMVESLFLRVLGGAVLGVTGRLMAAKLFLQRVVNLAPALYRWYHH